MPIIHPVVNISNSSSSNTMVNTHNSNINSSTLLKAMALLINIMQLCNEMCVTEWAVQFNHKAFCVTRAVVTLCHHHHNPGRTQNLNQSGDQPGLCTSL